MLFKQLQLLQLTDSLNYSPEALAEKLAPLAFTPCLPSFPYSIGWVSPFIDAEEGPLVHAMNGNILLCMQLEEKILPAAVIRQTLNEKIKNIEARDDRKMRQKEKLSLKDEVTMTLLPRAFTKLTRVYAYIDTKNQWLVLGTTHAGKTEQFMMLFKKSVSENVFPFDLKKLSPLMTHWLKTQDYPTIFSIEKACVLQDASQQTRIIRCQQQDLFASSIQALIKDGCEVKQLAMCWFDRVNFVLAEDCSLRSIKFQEEILAQVNEIDTETQQQRFDADFFITTETFSGLIKDLLGLFMNPEKQNKVQEVSSVV